MRLFKTHFKDEKKIMLHLHWNYVKIKLSWNDYHLKGCLQKNKNKKAYFGTLSQSFLTPPPYVNWNICLIDKCLRANKIFAPKNLCIEMVLDPIIFRSKYFFFCLDHTMALLFQPHINFSRINGLWSIEEMVTTGHFMIFIPQY